MSLIAPAGSAMGSKLTPQPHIIRRRSEPFRGRRALSPANASNQMNYGCHHMRNQIDHVALSQRRMDVQITANSSRPGISSTILRCMLIMSPFCFGSFERANHSQLRSRYASLINAPGPLLLQTPEEIHICKLLHLIDIRGLCYLLVVEQYPGSALLVRQLLADKCNVVSSVDRTALVADNGLQLVVCRELVASWLQFCL